MIAPMARDIGSPLTSVEVTVAEPDKGMRLDHLLARDFPWRSRADWQRRIHEDQVLVNGMAARPAQRLQPGMCLKLLVGEAEGVATDIPVDMPLHFLHEDPWLLAIDKSSGTVVHPVGRHVNDTLLNVLHARHASTAHPIGRNAPMIVHRLDKDTSGVLVFATDESVRKSVGLAFETRRVEKSYLALVRGEPRDDCGDIDLPIGPDVASAIHLKQTVVATGRPARTSFETLLRCGAFSLVRFRPLTGRQHQIRVHAEAMGHALLCDRMYGVDDPDPECVRPFSDALGHTLLRQALHAEQLTLMHPITGELLHLHAPLAPDLAALLPPNAYRDVIARRA